VHHASGFEDGERGQELRIVGSFSSKKWITLKLPESNAALPAITLI
jgi:hypothetical protein